jgi:peptidoglycan hydrolase-like protein with peptidoglycan-binding domain
MLFVRRLALVVATAALLSGTAFGVGWATRTGHPQPDPPSDRGSQARGPAGTGTDTPQAPGATADPTPTPAPEPPSRPEPKPEPELQPGPALLAEGDEGEEVRELQARLRQIDWFQADVTGFYGDLTVEAVRGFQAKREIPVTGEVDRRTLDRLHGMTTEPTAAELANQLGSNVPGALDPRCETGRALCVDKSSDTLRWVVDGQVLKTVDVRFGGASTPTREGTFSVTYKSRDHVSSLYDTSMPFAMFFSRGQAVHYSPDFASVGYAGASHGCVNVRDYDAVAWLYDQVSVGDKVVVYWS